MFWSVLRDLDLAVLDPADREVAAAVVHQGRCLGEQLHVRQHVEVDAADLRNDVNGGCDVDVLQDRDVPDGDVHEAVLLRLCGCWPRNSHHHQAGCTYRPRQRSRDPLIGLSPSVRSCRTTVLRYPSPLRISLIACPQRHAHRPGWSRKPRGAPRDGRAPWPSTESRWTSGGRRALVGLRPFTAIGEGVDDLDARASIQVGERDSSRGGRALGSRLGAEGTPSSWVTSGRGRRAPRPLVPRLRAQALPAAGPPRFPRRCGPARVQPLREGMSPAAARPGSFVSEDDRAPVGLAHGAVGTAAVRAPAEDEDRPDEHAAGAEEVHGGPSVGGRPREDASPQ
ncbi:MAG: hypothetical protein AVDCRST_MAG36-1355 [uncultured Nocardioidaceae bacterium]|uniref:Uncharacterized protein n=1 Tax=uncultured Nocardioidaceae bacterium TaxID=253824 RepID=A0A6J4LU11_9ACTN|nr:MAG: hypothetical protein AVDCRST_MAG36-1355 [uncultured Nocardioidaceae bacterium]